MSTQTATTGRTGIANTTPKRLVAGAAGGFVGSLLMGVLMQTLNPGTMQMGIPAMYGFEGPAPTIGWAFHQYHGVVLGVGYVLGVENVRSLRQSARRLGGAVGLGVGYGVATTALPVFVMPLWLSTMGFGGAPPFPNLAIPGTLISAAMHVVYAVPVALAHYVAAGDAS
ncbi:uncharacterized protein Nmlp_1519 [Natronomonas moolapensis 8.8.11]|uniref:Histidine kinase n=1 Tax=Natronomonas moolapensis (strain DSM 18674 / CECT 7526 / JCM 14361 / 8.8.11) TaxID=268739 RepID=M1XZW0_NATM8|nr:hypothetical protein [Natronomonas moolapensis]CCQ35720.1 uncharacterized protein Nmlp_1519 [Natronomonas moolapensis 8.8.11]